MTILKSSIATDGTGYDIRDYSGESFRLSRKAIITSVKFNLIKAGSPAGNVTAEIYAHTGTFGSTGKPTGSPLAVSNNSIVATSISGSGGLYEFFFSSPVLDAGDYFVVANHVYVNSSNFIGMNGTADISSYEGNAARTTSGVWGSMSYDYIFYLYGHYTPNITGVQSITGIQSIQF